MTIRCGCPDEADDIVFGPVHQCSNVKDRCVCRPYGIRSCPVHTPPEPRYMETLDESERGGH